MKNSTGRGKNGNHPTGRIDGGNSAMVKLSRRSPDRLQLGSLRSDRTAGGSTMTTKKGLLKLVAPCQPYCLASRNYITLQKIRKR